MAGEYHQFTKCLLTDAAFLLRTNKVVPLGSGRASYPSNDILPMAGRKLLLHFQHAWWSYVVCVPEGVKGWGICRHHFYFEFTKGSKTPTEKSVGVLLLRERSKIIIFSIH